MSEPTSIYGHNITDLLTNAESKIDKSDDDFKHTLEYLGQTAHNSNQCLTTTGLKNVESNIKGSEIECHSGVDETFQGLNHYADTHLV